MFDKIGGLEDKLIFLSSNLYKTNSTKFFSSVSVICPIQILLI